ncbi:MAG: glucosaminidase domain-containing protein [Eubacteriaceae bacterium]|nr:glucosaminidase domain-containing protein [Eubacteriaceae bacterium]
MKKALSIMVFIVFLSAVLSPAAAAFAAGEYTVDKANTDGSYTNLDSFSTYDGAFRYFSSSSDRDTVLRNASGKVIAMKEGMAVTDSSDATLIFSSTLQGGIPAYCQNGVACYYISTDAGQNATISVAGFRGSCPVSNLILIPSAFVYPRKTGERANRYEFDCYVSENGDLVHYISLYNWGRDVTDFYELPLDKAPSFMEEHVRYYSLDGIHYYLDPYEAVRGENLKGTHYIYYDLLSFRTKTCYSAQEINAYIAYKDSIYNDYHDSVYLNNAQAFLNAQELYGINALMELAFADHESGYGTSDIALDKNNIFGINAVDSAAYSNATYYTSVTSCILEHSRYTLSQGYLDAYAYIDYSRGYGYYSVSGEDYDWIDYYTGDSRYFGTNLGNKQYGVNVKYASDPWHGEKIASKVYTCDKYLGGRDYGRYTIGVTNCITYVYARPDTSSWRVYKYSSRDPGRSGGWLSEGPVGMPVVILGEEGDFYLIQSDMPMNSDGLASYLWDYDYQLSRGYVLKSDVDVVYTAGTIPVLNSDLTDVNSPTYDISLTDQAVTNISANTSIADFMAAFDNGSVRVFSAGTEVEDGLVGTGMSIKLYDEEGVYNTTYVAAVTADLNGDGRITSTDIVILARYLAGLTQLEGAFLIAADINGSGGVSSTDIVILARHLAGIRLIQ